MIRLTKAMTFELIVGWTLVLHAGCTPAPEGADPPSSQAELAVSPTVEPVLPEDGP